MPEHLPPELLALREQVQTFIDEQLRPLEDGLAADAELGDVDAQQRVEVRRRSREAGIFGMTQPQEFGGSAAGPLALTVARETLAAANLRLTSFVFGPAPGVLEGVDGALRTDYLEPLMRGEKAAGFAFTEPSGPDAGRQTYAVPDGDQLLVTGRKSYVTSGPFCDFYNVLVNIEPGAGSEGGPVMLLVDRDTPGLTVPREFSSMDGARHCELAFESMAVPRSHIVGEVGGGMNRALGQIGEERLAVGASSAGIAMWTVNYTRERISQPHPRGGTLGDREGVRRIFAEMVIESYAVRATVYRTARLAEDGVDVMNEGAAAKVFAAETVGRVVDQAMQLAGGDALTRGHPLERLYREVRSLRVGGGATDILRLNVARGMLEFNAGRV